MIFTASVAFIAFMAKANLAFAAAAAVAAATAAAMLFTIYAGRLRDTHGYGTDIVPTTEWHGTTRRVRSPRVHAWQRKA